MEQGPEWPRASRVATCWSLPLLGLGLVALPWIFLDQDPPPGFNVAAATLAALVAVAFGPALLAAWVDQRRR